MKNRLECTVTACRHNDHELCDLPGIKVEGPGACESCQTCCESFEPRSASGSNAVSGGCASAETSIDCKAQNCAYNHDCRCEADCVCVGCTCTSAASGANVDSKSGTECCTFRQG